MTNPPELEKLALQRDATSAGRMQAAPSYRWGLGFIAKRWRHVFWLLPLAGLLIGLGLQIWTIYGPTAIGIVQARPTPARYSPTHFSEVATEFQSDDILSKTSYSLDLPGRWQLHREACVLRLRKMIGTKCIPGTSLIEFRVTGRSRRESIEIWKAIHAHANEHFVDIRVAAEQAKLDEERAKIKVLEDDREQRRQELSSAIRRNNPLKVDIGKLRADFEATQKALEAAKIHLISGEMQCWLMENPILVHEEPVIPPSWLHKDVLRPLLHHAGIGFSIGMILAAPVAYLLELLFPRKQREHV